MMALPCCSSPMISAVGGGVMRRPVRHLRRPDRGSGTGWRRCCGRRHHPYTQALLACLSGALATSFVWAFPAPRCRSPLRMPPGCRFAATLPVGLSRLVPLPCLTSHTTAGSGADVRCVPRGMTEPLLQTTDDTLGPAGRIFCSWFRRSCPTAACRQRRQPGDFPGEILALVG